MDSNKATGRKSIGSDHGSVDDAANDAHDAMSKEAAKTAEVEPPYSVYTTREIYFFGVFVGLAGLLSTISNSLFFPVLPNIQESFHISTGLTNLSVVIYLIFQSLSPMILAGLADKLGRKPVMDVMIVCYIGICIGMSQVRVYWALVVLRFCQATSAASTISIGFGIVADLMPKQTRGGFGGFLSGFVLTGQACGGLIGGALAAKWDWPGIFVFSAIAGGIALIGVLAIIPETNRTLVGNSSIVLPQWYYKSVVTYLPKFKPRYVHDTSTIIPRQNVSVLTSAAKIFFSVRVFLTILPPGLAFAGWTASMTALSTEVTKRYGFTEIEVGLAYLAPGFGSIVGSIGGGMAMNWNYRRRYAQFKALSLPEDQFNVLSVRSEFSGTLMSVYAGGTLVFGWCLDKHTHLAPIIIAHFVLSVASVWYLSISQTILIDLFPSQSSASSSCLNLMRGLASAIIVAALDKMIKSLTIGGCFTLLPGLALLSYGIFEVYLYFIKKKEEINDN